jgi:pimeloyl-ACP methyl ester carboxylesterase
MVGTHMDHVDQLKHGDRGSPQFDIAKVRTVAVADTTLTYTERGHGTPVVFVHGDLSDLRTWEPQLDGVGGSHRAIAYSRRYARPNPDISPGTPNDLMRHADDLAAFVRAVNASPAHLVGDSLGAVICLLAARRHPETVRSLVLLEPPALTLFISVPPRPAELVRVMARHPRTGLAIMRFGATTMVPALKAFRRGNDDKGMQAFVSGVVGAQRFAALPAERHRQAKDNVSALKAGLLHGGLPRITDDDVRAITAPTLLVGGDASPSIFRHLMDHLAELLPNAERTVIAEAGHVLHEERPAETNQAILAFLRRHA